MVNKFWVGHVLPGVLVTSGTIPLVYHMFRRYIECLNTGTEFRSTFHIYLKRWPKVSCTTLALLLFGFFDFLGVGFEMVIHDIGMVPYYNAEKKAYYPCCGNIDHFSGAALIFLCALMLLIIQTTPMHWPKGLDKFILFLLLATVGGAYLQHGIMKTHPVDSALHTCLAITFFIASFSFLVEIQHYRSMVLNFVRNLFLLTSGTFLIQIGFMYGNTPFTKSERLSERFDPENDANVSFVVITFIWHVVGNTFLMVMTYMVMMRRHGAQRHVRTGGSSAPLLPPTYQPLLVKEHSSEDRNGNLISAAQQ